MKTIGVLGAGTIGRLIIEDLQRSFDGRIVVIGHKKKKFVPAPGASVKRTEFCFGDVTDPRSLVRALTGIPVVIHAVHHEYNLAVMQACLKTKTHYLDLGGLYHYTKKQLALDAKFRKAGLLAILGMGAAPGITNLMAAFGAADFEHVDRIDIRIGSVDQSRYSRTSPLSNTYSLQTILEECTWKPAVFIHGKIRFLEAFSGRIPFVFPKPVGEQRAQFTIHSELATLPSTLKAQNVTFKIAFDDDFVDRIQALKSVGLLEPKNLATTVAILNRLRKPIAEKIQQYEIIRVELLGKKNRKSHTVELEAHVKGIRETIDKDTAAPASIVAQWMAQGKFSKTGVFPPESVIDPLSLFKKLSLRGILFFKNSKPLP